MKPTIYVYDTAAAGGVDFDPVGQVTSYKSFVSIKAWNSPGSFSITINRNCQGAKYLKANRVIILEDGFKGYIESIEDAQQDNRAKAFITVSGTELKDQLFRITVPPEGQDTDNYTSQPVETIAKALISKNAAALAAAVRQINGLELAEDQERGSVISFSTRHKELLSELYALLAVDRMGLVVEYDAEAETITYDVAEGVDRTQGQDENSQVIISVDWKTASAYIRKQDQSAYRNVAITAGQGEGKDRTIVVVGETDATGYARRETFVDARDIADDGELPDRGAQKLAEAQKITGVTVTFNNNGAFKIDQNFKVGDLVTALHTDVDGNEVADDLQVVSATYKYSADVGYPDISLVLDYDPDDIARVIANKLSSYNALLSKEGGGGGGVTGPDGATAGNVPVFADATGKTLEDSGIKITDWQTWDAETGMTGFSSIPANGVYYYRYVGNEIEIMIRQPANGTSNATGFDIPLPVQAANITGLVWLSWAVIVDNGTQQPGRLFINSGGTTLSVNASESGAAFTSSGSKRCAYGSIRYIPAS